MLYLECCCPHESVLSQNLQVVQQPVSSECRLAKHIHYASKLVCGGSRQVVIDVIQFAQELTQPEQPACMLQAC